MNRFINLDSQSTPVNSSTPIRPATSGKLGTSDGSVRHGDPFRPTIDPDPSAVRNDQLLSWGAPRIARLGHTGEPRAGMSAVRVGHTFRDVAEVNSYVNSYVNVDA